MTSRFLTAGMLHPGCSALRSRRRRLSPFAAPLESSMDASAARQWNYGLPSLNRPERDCGISG